MTGNELVYIKGNLVLQDERLILLVVRADVTQNSGEIRCHRQNAHGNGYIHGSISVCGELNG